MRSVSSAVSATINGSSNIRFFVATEITTPHLTIRTSTLSFPFTTGGKTYNPDTGMVEYEPPRVSTTLDKQTYKLSFTDHSNEFHELFKLGIRGSKTLVSMGFFDSQNNPITNPEHWILMYSGFIDSYSISNDWVKKVAIIECASPMSDLDSIGAFPGSRDGWRQYNPTDTSFDSIYDGGKGIDLKWGKA